MKIFFVVFGLFLCSIFSLLSAYCSEIPNQATNVGYCTNTFESYFNKDVDIYNIKNTNFKWFTDRFFNWDAVPISSFKYTDEGLIIKTGRNYEIATAAPAKGGKKWVGIAFGGGGYFEAELKFDPNTVLKSDRVGWPSFWSMSIEHLANFPSKQWYGQPDGYDHFIEVDFFEYYFKEFADREFYIGNMHDTYGIWKVTCPGKQFCMHSLPYSEARKRVPSDTDFNVFHKYGFLWVPATKNSLGYGQFYFDDQPIGNKITWEIFDDQPPSRKKEKWTFGILDRQHIVIILGTGLNQPLNVRSVKVWQKNSNNNLISK